jgi:hypothetical protein
MPHRRVSSGPICVAAFLLFACSSARAQSFISTFPQFATGGGWTSDFFISNQGGTSAVVDISFYGDDGGALTVDCTLGVGPSFSVTLGGGATQAIRVTSTAELKTGYVILSIPSGASIRASEVFRYTQNGVVLSSLGVAQQFALTSFSCPAEVSTARGVNTGLALANGAFDTAGASEQSCVVNLVRSDGTRQDTAVIKLGAKEHLSAYLNSDRLFPGLDEFSGTVSVSATFPIGVVALRQDGPAFATVAVDAGPILAPFLLTTGAINEVEPNTTPTQAQRINPPVVVSGNISIPSISYDDDYYQFTGTKGDVLTALVSTASLSSSMDSVLYLLSSDGRTILAQNDENGLFFSHDSFIQVILPSDGTYYLVVTDYASGFGAYRLHVQFLKPRN